MKDPDKTTVGWASRSGSAPLFKAGWARRAIGGLHLALGALFLLIGPLLSESPGIFSAADPPYQVPYACAGLECIHGYVNGPKGGLYCAKFPPRELLDARMSPAAKQARLTTAAICGIAGLCFAVLTPVCGLLWLAGLWIPEQPARWHTVVCRAAPLIAIGCWVAACALKAIYPLAPM